MPSGPAMRASRPSGAASASAATPSPPATPATPATHSTPAARSTPATASRRSARARRQPGDWWAGGSGRASAKRPRSPAQPEVARKRVSRDVSRGGPGGSGGPGGPGARGLGEHGVLGVSGGRGVRTPARARGAARAARVEGDALLVSESSTKGEEKVREVVPVEGRSDVDMSGVEQEDRGVAGATFARNVDLKFTSVQAADGAVSVAIALSVNNSYTGVLEVPAKTDTGAQRALKGDEFFLVQSGHVLLEIGDTRYSLHSGDHVAIPHESCYSFVNQASICCRLVFFVPRNPYG